jgi:hypothetical protein
MITIEEEKINNLDDMAELFFKIARLLGHPLKNINLELTKTWGEQTKEIDGGNVNGKEKG